MEQKLTIMDIFWKEELLCNTQWGDDKHWVTVKNFTGKKHPLVPYVMKEDIEYKISIMDLNKFLETRCFPRTRYNVEELLKKYDLRFYYPYGICVKSHGVSMTDFLWLRFDNERLTYDDVRLR